MEAKFRSKICSLLPPIGKHQQIVTLLLCDYDNRNWYKKQEKLSLNKHKHLLLKQLRRKKSVFLSANKIDY